MVSSPAIPELLQRQAQVRGETPALMTAEGESLTYEAWWKSSCAMAAGIAEAGVGPGDRVAVIGSNAAYADTGVAYVGVLLAGAVALPLSGSQPRHELEHAIGRADVALVVVCDPAIDPTPTWRAARLVDLLVDGANDSSRPPLALDAPAEVLYTSGTTGLPRLVEADHGNLTADFSVEPRHDPDPYHYVHALTFGTNIGQVALRSSLTLGYTVVALEALDLDRYVDLARALPMRETLLVPAMAASLAAEAAHRRWVLPAVEILAVTGAATPPATWRRLSPVVPNAQLINTYSTTEAWPARATTVVDPQRLDSVGRPLDDQAVEIRDDDGRRLDPFERGTVYLADRTASARRYVDGRAPGPVDAHGWVETDDLGYLDDEGFLYLEDRKNDVVATGGYTVSTLEVERALVEHPRVVEAAAFGLTHRVLGECVAACVVGPDDLDLDDVERLARERLAPHKVPRRLLRTPWLPRTRSGKVAKAALRSRMEGVDTPAIDDVRSPDEARIRDIWEDVMERSGIGVDQAFFNLGGDSLSALRIVARIRSELVTEVPTASLLAASTIAEQAAVVGAARTQP